MLSKQHLQQGNLLSKSLDGLLSSAILQPTMIDPFVWPNAWARQRTMTPPSAQIPKLSFTDIIQKMRISEVEVHIDRRGKAFVVRQFLAANLWRLVRPHGPAILPCSAVARDFSADRRWPAFKWCSMSAISAMRGERFSSRMVHRRPGRSAQEPAFHATCQLPPTG